MRQSSVRGERGRRRAPEARDLGWDDSMYEEGADPNVTAPQGKGEHSGKGRGERHRRGGPRKKRGRGARILRWTAFSAAVLILGTAGAGYFYYEHLSGNIKKGDLNLGKNRLDRSAANAKGQRPLNILLLGSDSRNSAENVALGGSHRDVGRKPLADVQMLLHVSADRSNMSVISIPRDTRVTIPECKDPDDGKVYRKTDREIINASLMNGGPGCTVATWEELTGIPVDHFMMIDFAGVVNMADAVGGVPVCVKNNVYDKLSGLRLEKGDHKVKGKQALQWLRTRHGFEDGSDIGRTHAQHMYMNAMVRQLKSGTKLTDPGQLSDLAEAATKALTVDKGLGTPKKLYDLTDELKQVSTKRITMTTMPWIQDPLNPKAHVVPKPGDADKLFSLVRDDKSLDGKDKKDKDKKDEKGAGQDKKTTPSDPAAPKGEIGVTVQNGTGTASQAPAPGRAGTISAELVKEGFTKAAADTTPKTQATTVISYPKADKRGDAQAVAKALGLPDSALRMSTSVQQITLVVGADWRTGTSYPKDAGSDDKSDDKAPDSSAALNGDDSAACMDVNPLNRF
ncbi:LCP family protein [Streptomyces sp. NPDC050617]|uniref:LCP family protein n=1 Tax=Streptomyces sp. NPDC050617 TaxID=3154628 RepID=UPI003430A40F